MELREYVRIILKSWWLIVPITLLSLSVALFFSYQQIPIYESTTSYVTGLSTGIGNTPDTIYAFDTLTGRDRIFVTYCKIMESDAVWRRAQELLGMNPDAPGIDLKLYTRACSNLPSSNILLLVVQGPSPQLVSDLNTAIGLAGIEQGNPMFPYFPVTRLDPVYLEPEPISPSHSRDALLGGAIGLVISVTIALVLDNLRSPLERLESLSIRDPLLNTFNDRYFQQRLTEEVNRARIRYRPLSMVFSRLVPNEDFALLPENIQDMLMRNAAMYMQNMLREGDLLAYNRKQDIFEILLPETPNHEAKELVTKLHTEVRNQTFRVDQYVSNFSMSSGVVEGSGETLELQTMIQQAIKALEKARQNGENTIVFMRGAPSPFVLEDTDMDGIPARSASTEMNEYVEVPLPAPISAPSLGANSSAGTVKESRSLSASAAPGSAFVGWDDTPDNSESYGDDYVSAWLGSSSPSNGIDLNSMIADVRPMDDLDTESENRAGDNHKDG
ncbi:MAG: diguanylate cyclase [Anaerolineae bacterium]